MDNQNTSNPLVGSILKIHSNRLEELKDWQVIMGFSGFGHVGYLTLSHIIETAELESFCFWGQNSWFYRNNLESIITGYLHHESKSILITSRLPIFVSSMTKQFWDRMVEDVLNWGCKRYIVIGGLREDTRERDSTDWAAFVPTRQWSQKYKHERTFEEKLTMIGPLSSMLTLGTAMEKPVLGLLAYCNLEEDPDASLFTLGQLETLAGLKIKNKDQLHTFDFSFLSTGLAQNDEILDETEYDDDDEFNIEDLL